MEHSADMLLSHMELCVTRTYTEMRVAHNQEQYQFWRSRIEAEHKTYLACLDAYAMFRWDD